MINLIDIVRRNGMQRTMLLSELTSGVIGAIIPLALNEINKELAALSAPSAITAEEAIKFTVAYKELLQQKQTFQNFILLREQLQTELHPDI